MEIKVNDAEWKSLGNDERKRIEDIVKGFFKEAKIVPDPSTPASGIDTRALALINPWCKAACDIAEGAAVAACASLANPIAIAACITAAHAAGDACRSRC